ncbi:hypothetical protein RM704_29960, partial [Streptomyces sp. DSM 3412]|nr:hypothetical protein [Streptomyces sp. DSM 3412]
PAHPSHLASADPHHLTASAPGREPSVGLTAGVEAAPTAPPWLTTPDPDVALLQRLRDALEAL